MNDLPFGKYFSALTVPAIAALALSICAFLAAPGYAIALVFGALALAVTGMLFGWLLHAPIRRLLVSSSVGHGRAFGVAGLVWIPAWFFAPLTYQAVGWVWLQALQANGMRISDGGAVGAFSANLYGNVLGVALATLAICLVGCALLLGTRNPHARFSRESHKTGASEADWSRPPPSAVCFPKSKRHTSHNALSCRECVVDGTARDSQ